MPRPQAGLGFGRSGPRVLLQKTVRVLTPSGALSDQAKLGLALAHHQTLDERCERKDGVPADLAQRRPLVAEDARVAVLIGAGRPRDAHVEEHPSQDDHRVLDPRVLGVGLDSFELGLGAHTFDLELGDEDGHVPRGVRDERDGALRREKAEAREVLDVGLVEEHVARELQAPDVLEQRVAPRLELRRRDPCRHRLHGASLSNSSGHAADDPSRECRYVRGRRLPVVHTRPDASS